jgi:ubiquinone/menaquinone biosynthesis C-methylase UbiE
VSDVVREWYEDQKNVDEMLHWDKGILKKWEQGVVTYFPENAKVLDVGCGMGREAFALNDMGFTVIGIDISEKVINQVTELSKQNGYSIPFSVYDGHTLPYEDNTFDVVIIWAQTFGIMHGNTYKVKFLHECKRILKKEGLLSFSGHDYKYVTKNYKQYIDGRKFYPYANSEIYWETFLPEELTTYATSAGFAVMLCEQGEIYKHEDGVILHCLCRK